MCKGAALDDLFGDGIEHDRHCFVLVFLGDRALSLVIYIHNNTAKVSRFVQLARSSCGFRDCDMISF